MSVDYVRLILALLAVIALLGGLGLILKRMTQAGLGVWGAGRTAKNMAIAENLFLDPKRRLVRVANGHRQYVLLLSNNGDRVVDTYSDPAHGSDLEHDAHPDEQPLDTLGRPGRTSRTGRTGRTGVASVADAGGSNLPAAATRDGKAAGNSSIPAIAGSSARLSFRQALGAVLRGQGAPR
ncbi:MAG: hypothetical protein K0U36_02305 [Alphaproteobacteria bacterium]|nr:hypothetical protein [Alphaproteobacteria bacterium]